MSVKRILIATPMYPPTIGGPSTYVSLIEKGLKKNGYQVGIVSFDNFLHFPKVLRHFLYFCKIFYHAFRFDVIYAHDPISVGLPSLLAAFFSFRPFTMGVHGDYVWEQSAQRFGVKDSIDDFQNKKYGFKVEFFRFIQKKVVGCAKFAVTPSDYLRDIVRKWVKNPDRIVTTYFATNLGNIPRAEVSWRGKIFSAGRLVPWKGFSLLIDILKDLPSNWELLIIGDGPERDRLNKKVLDLGLSKRVYFTGAISHESLIEKMVSSDLFILNSSFESFSFQTVEAMKAGLPIIVTNIGSFPEVVRDGVDGILVDPDNREQIIKAFNKYDQDVNFRKNAMNSARSRADYFSVDSTVSRLIKLFENI